MHRKTHALALGANTFPRACTNGLGGLGLSRRHQQHTHVYLLFKLSPWRPRPPNLQTLQTRS